MTMQDCLVQNQTNITSFSPANEFELAPEKIAADKFTDLIDQVFENAAAIRGAITLSDDRQEESLTLTMPTTDANVYYDIKLKRPTQSANQNSESVSPQVILQEVNQQMGGRSLSYRLANQVIYSHNVTPVAVSDPYQPIKFVDQNYRVINNIAEIDRLAEVLDAADVTYTPQSPLSAFMTA